MRRNPARAKKTAIILIAAVAALALVLFCLSLVFERKALPAVFSLPDIDYHFYEPDWESDIFENNGYLSKNRSISYTDDMGQTVLISDGDYSNYGVGPAFFSLYFYAIEHGDADTYNSLFTEEYYKTNDRKQKFTMQKVYNIELKLLSSDKLDDGRYSALFSLDYYIMRNDGTFRRDIGSDMTRTQYVTLYYNSETALINNIKTEYRK